MKKKKTQPKIECEKSERKREETETRKIIRVQNLISQRSSDRDDRLLEHRERFRLANNLDDDAITTTTDVTFVGYLHNFQWSVNMNDDYACNNSCDDHCDCDR